ncbi:hypothetical protein [Longimicrobium sp.]|uniref:hypothetical protein n=1 Tax=Longimicrobium sp. TaxID=2029185 RepID=UPI002B8D2B22|nr:hypothetical protein [Longimicrobium sp.]HSU14628.1 hypothetical protein [Longimicrobium sp.]
MRSATVEVLRIFDVAESIDLDRVESLLAGRGTVARIRLTRVEPKAIAFGDPPVVTELPAPPMDVLGRRCPTRAAARIHAFGVVSVSLEVLLPEPLPWPGFEAFAREAEREAAALRFWRERLDALLDAIRPAMDDPSTIRVEEDYAIVTLRELDPKPARPLAEVVDLVPLLTQEARPLSAAARAEAMRYTHSYYTDDVVVLTWDRALVLEPGNDDDVADVLEVANAQLLELRVYDALLDREIPRIYDVAEAVQRRGVALFQRRYSRAANQMRALVAEISEITEKVENALKVTEDVYLARVYTSATELFRIPALAASIDRKLALIRETYTSLYDQAVATRAEWMEAAIIALIVLEVVLAIIAGRH